MGERAHLWAQIGRAVWTRRHELDLTQEQLAEAAGVAERTVSTLESGHVPTRRSPSWPKVEHALGWPTGTIDRWSEEGRVDDRRVNQLARAASDSEKQVVDERTEYLQRLDYIDVDDEDHHFIAKLIDDPDWRDVGKSLVELGEKRAFLLGIGIRDARDARNEQRQERKTLADRISGMFGLAPGR